MAMAFDLEPAVVLPWLVRLRWSFAAGQVVAIPIMAWWFGMPLVAPLLAIELALLAGSNIALSILRRRWPRPRAHVIAAIMALDTGLWTLLLAGAGGSANPFTVVYIVHIALAAIVLRPAWTAAITALSLCGFGLLFVATPAAAMMHHDPAGFAQHLQAMWGALALAAVLIAFFVGRVTRAIASQREQIAALRETSERNARHASVMRLAAGAAHELGSPLATIAIAAHEAKLHLLAAAKDGASEPPAAVLADLELVAAELERCQAILQRLSTRAGEHDADATLALPELADAIRDRLGEALSPRVELHVRDATCAIRQPPEPLIESVVALVKNAVEAMPTASSRVVVELAGDDRGAEITIVDTGNGIAPDELARVGTPFFTTKQVGRGMGLGVFLARAFVESRGGELALESRVGVGTRAVVRIPREAAT